ncbi:hypothetical protein DR64_7936 [Paraburkholderia xenovorans LB400]|uniref:DUF35 domain-containing protein n=1 Tax=Paraburkholderia xenovorans (strain LB400) TaxID=266265 RepID=Q13HM8_PARXL|nr:Zn-ribbon domain-containing OB-fold protein [Paraburkholderia xenovorans]ABE36411.1 Conserved hypothetical protein [Paraburkholderia xenovorans LB400]AIP34332.1 hypothetical protein DR64_7936 [Paraburkholderia xenovorans LB400]
MKDETNQEARPVRPHPVMTMDTEFFWNAAREHKLAIQRCCNCGKLRHPPMPSCPHCYSFEWDTVESAGNGTLLSYTVVYAPLVTPFTKPYAVGLVALDEGTRLVAELVDANFDELRIGMPAMLDFMDCEGDLTLPVFRVQRER